MEVKNYNQPVDASLFPEGCPRCSLLKFLLHLVPVAAVGLWGAYAAFRVLAHGLGETGRDDYFGFGLWITFDLAVIALGAGAFFTGALRYLLNLDALKNMRMMTAYQVGSKVDGKSAQGGLVGIRNGFFFISPVENDDNQFGALIFYLINIVLQLLFTIKVVVLLINTYKTDLHPFYVHNSSFIIAKVNDSCGVQCVHSVLEALLAVIKAVVVGCIYRFHRATGVNSGKGSRGFDCKGFVLAVIAFGESSLIIGNSQIICLENAFYILEKIFLSIAFEICVQAGIVIEIFICAKGAVTNHADGEGNRGVVGGFGRSSCGI